MEENNENPSSETPMPEAESGASALPTADVPPSPQQQDFSSQFAALSRQERELHLKQREMAAKEKKLSEMQERMTQYEKASALAKESPEAFLEANGISVKDLLARELNGGQTPESDLLRQQLDAQAKQIEDLRESQVAKEREVETQRLTQLKTSYVDQIREWVDNGERGDKYELVKASNAYETVYQVLQQEYNSSGRDMGFEAAAQVVEDYYRNELERYKDTRVLKELSGGSSEPVQNNPASSPAASEQTVRTTKTLENTSVATPAQPERPLTREERLAKFAESIRWA
tara:strand:- start:90 stop:953 length:864 start_codon:yes stop_codon:yes gene_type:complete